MVASTDIKFFVHTNNNAPQLQNAYGSMINVLDACLVNGINIGAVSSLTASGTIVTALFSSSHNLMQYQVIKITGANQSEFNGEHRILTVPNAQSVTFELAAAPSVSTATGTITASLPPLGWEKPFLSVNAGGGGKATYRSTNEFLPSRPYLRVVDELDPLWNANYAKFAKVGIVESMMDIDTMLGVQSPYDPTNPNKNWVGTGSGSGAINGWMKWYYAHGESSGLHISEPNQSDASSPANGARKWIIIGTKDSFIIANSPGVNTANYLINGFGKYKPYFGGDIFNDYISGLTWSGSASQSPESRGWSQGLVQGSTLNTIFTSRKLNGGTVGSTGTASAQRLTHSGYQNISALVGDIGEIIYTDVDLWADSVFRGKLPFIKWLYQAQPLPNFQFFEDNGVIYLALNTEFGSRYQGQLLLQIAGEL
ncbi:hypothetical protein HLH14_09290 [Acinetobacter sp. ANC 4282]|uniref:hypothetical protein n=1 Tax=Acinetobacter terrae TaxID=2731247 RepID=UPI00149052BD|nr:hypothetical protein [Acinetobacter terrae]NNH16186.1 hypothetical protein [Acinetobacter terrae]